MNIQQLLDEHRKLLCFVGIILRVHRKNGAGDVDGDTVQEAALTCDLLEPREVTEPCSMDCMCEEFPTECLFTTDLGERALRSEGD